MDNIRNFVDLIASGDNALARDELDKILSQKSFEALDARKQEIAGAIFGTTEQPEEIEDDLDSAVAEVAYAEGVEHDEDQDQLDELSKTTLASYQHKSRESFNKALKQMDANPVDLKYHHPGGMVDRSHVYRGEQRTKAAEVMKKRTAGFNRSYDRIGPNFDHVKK